MSKFRSLANTQLIFDSAVGLSQNGLEFR